MIPRASVTARPLPRRPVVLSLLGVVLLAAAPLGSAQEATPVTGDVAALLPTPGPLPEGAAPSGEPLRVVATTGILADLVRQVGGERVEARSILPANADPHDFEPAPADLAAAEAAGVLVRHGLGFDAFSEALLAVVAEGVPVVTATDGIPLLVRERDGRREADPHVWFDPRRASQMIDNITTGLIAADPDGETTYRERAAAYKEQLARLDAAIEAAIGTIPPDRRKIVTNHDALGYYADRYGLEIVGTVIPGLETTAEPSAADVAALLETIAAEGVRVVFAENTTSPVLAEQLAAEAGIAVVDDLYTDSLGEPGSGADSYLGLLRTDTIMIVEALR